MATSYLSWSADYIEYAKNLILVKTQYRNLNYIFLYYKKCLFVMFKTKILLMYDAVL
jgi:hypothetical protein